MGQSKSKSHKAFRDYDTQEQLLEAMKASGVLEDMEIIVGIDATKSNEMTGQRTYGGRCLHDFYKGENPYSSVMRTAVKFLERDQDAIYPLLYFGSEHAINSGGVLKVKDCHGVEDLVGTYKESIGSQVLSGPTLFTSLIKYSIDKVESTGKYHILLIITDGDVHNIADHYKMLNLASHKALSIVCIGVGDGPFKTMESFDDDMPPGRVFDNFQFVNFGEIMKYEADNLMKNEFFFRAFMEVPQQYMAIKKYLKYRPFLDRKVVASAPVYDQPPSYTMTSNGVT
jgi:E3 ubiquitin-protein ligase RGLG